MTELSPHIFEPPRPFEPVITEAVIVDHCPPGSAGGIRVISVAGHISMLGGTTSARPVELTNLAPEPSVIQPANPYRVGTYLWAITDMPEKWF